MQEIFLLISRARNILFIFAVLIAVMC